MGGDQPGGGSQARGSHAEGHRTSVEDLRAGGQRHQRQPGSAQLGRLVDPRPSGFDIGVPGLRMAWGGANPAAFQPAAVAVHHRIERRQPPGRELRRLFQHRPERLRTGVGVGPQQVAQPIQPRRRLDLGGDGVDVGGRNEVGHQCLVAMTREKCP